MNDFKNKIYIEAEENIVKNLDKNIYFLDVPTGGGKTNISINWARQILNLTPANKVFYIFPFNTLVDQTYEEFEKRFKYKEIVDGKEIDTIFDIEIHNSLSPIRTISNTGEKTNEKISIDDEEETLYDTDFDLSVLYRDMFANRVVLTSHVAFFRLLFNNSKGMNPLWQLSNSIIILDEIQSYRNSIWREIIEMISKYADILNFKIIIMSATLPPLEKLRGFKENNFIYLLKDSKVYFNHSLFKNRVEISNKYLIGKDRLIPQDCESLKNTIYNEYIDFRKIKDYDGNVRLLIEFIKKQSAKIFIKI